MRKKKYNYSVTRIISDWRNRKMQRGYAKILAKKHKVPVAVIHNVIYQHRKNKRATDSNYRQTKIYRKKSIFQSYVVFAGANYDAR